jgi:hypothetical protein
VNPRARAPVSAKLDIVAIDAGSRKSGKLGSVAGCHGASPKNRKYRDLQKPNLHSNILANLSGCHSFR